MSDNSEVNGNSPSEYGAADAHQRAIPAENRASAECVLPSEPHVATKTAPSRSNRFTDDDQSRRCSSDAYTPVARRTSKSVVTQRSSNAPSPIPLRKRPTTWRT